MKNKKTIGERFKSFRKAIKKTQKQIHEEASISQSNIARIEAGGMYPNFELIAFSHKNYNLNVHWLVTGEGKMFLEETTSNEQIENLFKLKYPGWKLSDFQLGKEILEEIGDTFILRRLSSYLEVAKNERNKLMSKD